MKTKGTFGNFGGVFVPQILFSVLERLEQEFINSKTDPEFKKELDLLLATYAGRPTPLYKCRNLLSEKENVSIFLKREDLLHGGAHKTNQVLAQALLAKRCGKTRLIAETGAGQHGVATAMVGALMGLETQIYMGKVDVERQAPNVARMKCLGAKVISVTTGAMTLKDAINEALRDWAHSYKSTHYLLGTVAGPHPFPTMVRDFQKIIGEEAKTQIVQETGSLPDAVIACVGGGSNAMGVFFDFIKEEKVALIGVEALGHGIDSGEHGATLQEGRSGILHGSRTLILQDEHAQVQEAYSISAGLDYPGVGPEHAYLQSIGRAKYVGVTDDEALDAFNALAANEGILPALESSHALAHAIKMGRAATEPLTLLVNLSGRGDKDMETIMKLRNEGKL